MTQLPPFDFDASWGSPQEVEESTARVWEEWLNEDLAPLIGVAWCARMHVYGGRVHWQLNTTFQDRIRYARARLEEDHG